MLVGERVRVQPIDPPLAQALLAGVPSAGLAWEEGYPMTPVLGISRRIVAAAEPLGSFSAYVIVRLADGLAIGDAGFHGPPSDGGEAEIGYALAPAARGSGFIHEALALLIAWASSEPSVRVLTARVDAGNVASERVLGRLGFARDGGQGGMNSYVLARSSPGPDESSARARL
jgi:RimJ/RimL family protein N-acetyltransferase